METNGLQQIEAELGRVDAATMFGPASVEIAAAIVGGVPILGPVLGVFVKRIGDQALSPDLHDLLLRTVWEIEELVPEVAKVGSLEQRIAILEARKGDDDLARLLAKAATIATKPDDAVRLYTDDGTLSAKNLEVEGREFLSSATGASSVDLSNLTQSGAPATIRTSKGATQNLDGASFRRSDSSASTSAQFGNEVTHLGGYTEMNVRDGRKTAALSHESDGSNSFGIRISDGPDGRPKIEFG